MKSEKGKSKVEHSRECENNTPPTFSKDELKIIEDMLDTHSVATTNAGRWLEEKEYAVIEKVRKELRCLEG